MPTSWIYSDTVAEALNMEYVMHVAFTFRGSVRGSVPPRATSDVRGATVTCRTGEKFTVDASTAEAIRLWLRAQAPAGSGGEKADA